MRARSAFGAALTASFFLFACSQDDSLTFGGGVDTGGAGSSSTGSGGTVVGLPTMGGAGGAGGGATGQCQGLQCRQKSCTTGSTTISGTVFDPGGTLPLYNVMVYVPNAPLAPLSSGASCACEVSGSPIASALTDTHGHFTLTNAPVGNDVPLVIQIGKWRRSFTIPSVAECADTAVPQSTLRLPARQADGDMPKIALTTGNADALECLIPKLGIDAAEFTPPSGSGRINYFSGHGGTNKYVAARNGGVSFPTAQSLWGNVDSLKAYDVVLLSCEGGMFPDEKGAAAFQAMAAYANLGGRVFASHWHEVWFTNGPAPFPNVATFVNEPDLGNLTADVITSFPKGAALADWLVNVGASSTKGKIDITAAQHTVTTENPTYAQRWIASDPQHSVQYLSANTPLGVAADKQCGRVVLSDIHVSGGTGRNSTSDRSSPDLAFPSGCVTSGFSPQEKVLAFMLFDISACLIPDDDVPQPPVIVK
ncbi:MAG: carboxypeptidase regulatory-like domain-containing protein [Polyangiaceae bacterium]